MDCVMPGDNRFEIVNIENNRETIDFLWLDCCDVDMLLELDNILTDKEKREELKETLQYPFRGDIKQWIGKLEVFYKNNNKELVEDTLYFEFNNYILEFGLPKFRNKKHVYYYLKHIHELDISVKSKRKSLGTEDKVLTAEEIDQLLIQGKIHQII